MEKFETTETTGSTQLVETTESTQTKQNKEKTAFSKRVKNVWKAFLGSVKEHKWIYLYFTIIGIIFLLTRLIQITELPKGLHIDEVSMGYNTWALTNFGTDRYGVSMPIYFNNAGSGQSSLYVYLAVLVSKVLGYSVFSLRVVSVFFGALLLIFGTKAAYEMFGLKCSLITAAVIDIMPLFLMSERWAFDCNAMLPMLVMFLYFYVRLIKTQKMKYAFASGITFGITMYSYILAVLMLPVFVVFAAIYSLIMKKITIKHIGAIFFSGLIVASPILLYLFVVIGVIPEFHIGPISFTNASAGRANEIEWQGFSFKELMKALYTLTSYDQYDFMADDKYGVFYQNILHFFEYKISVSQILLIVAFAAMVGIGIYSIIKKKGFSFEILMVFYMIAMIYPIFFLEQVAIYRYNAVYFSFALLLAYLFSKLWDHKRYVLCGLFALLYLYNFGSYSYYLFSGNFAEDNKALAYFDYDLLELCETFDDDEYKDYQIYVDYTATYNAGLITLYGLRVEPEIVASEVENVDSKIMTYGNIHIGIPDIIDADQKSIFVIRDINSETTFYTTNIAQIDLYKTLVINNKAKELLMNLDTPYDIVNNYYVFKLN